ncbi:MAG: secreted PhoX family phosphatase [Halieaceae bacterium]|jgi:secreted PhoX family phosphatase
MINRRRFTQSLLAATAAPLYACAGKRSDQFGKLTTDKSKVLDLPSAWKYSIIARHGEEMADGLLVPARADGMAAFPGNSGLINLVCNHENAPLQQGFGPFGSDLSRLAQIKPSNIYDAGDGVTPGNGGTTTIVYDPVGRKKVRQFLSLAGTEYNCAGGATPWGSWLSCEEAFSNPGTIEAAGKTTTREQSHGYVFEVHANASGLTKPEPLRDMGRFEHEAAAVEPNSGVVYLTEDRHRSLLYRFIPNSPGHLAKGGVLQALAIAGHDQFDTRNWDDKGQMKAGEWLETRWITLENPDGDTNDLRLRGFDQGAARFARGEGLCYADGSIFVGCTSGGPAKLGQIFEYRVSPVEGAAKEVQQPGRIRLLAESARGAVLQHADNLIMSPWGDLIVCEDGPGHCSLVGIRPDGRQYQLARNPEESSELAGICFSPDGKTMFLNIQKRGLTVAINGPW